MAVIVLPTLVGGLKAFGGELVHELGRHEYKPGHLSSC
jgi:hypothetical protein